jgi:hypothetical protein
MYLDRLGLVTTGVGNLVDPIESALSLPWKNQDGSRASPAEIRSAWNTVKARQDWKGRGGGYFGGLTTIRLDDEGVKEIVHRKLLQNEDILRKRFPSYDNWPADAQLGLLSMAWAMGPNFQFPKFQSAVNQLLPDFVTAAAESDIHAPGDNAVADRNEQNKILFTNAAKVLREQLDVDRLYWPLNLLRDAVPTSPAVKTGFGVGAGIALLGAAGFAAYRAFKG